MTTGSYFVEGLPNESDPEVEPEVIDTIPEIIITDQNENIIADIVPIAEETPHEFRLESAETPVTKMFQELYGATCAIEGLPSDHGVKSISFGISENAQAGEGRVQGS